MSVARRVVTVDGLAASGKSALAQLLAARLGFQHLNTGLLYRAVAWLALKEGGDLEGTASLMSIVGRHEITLARESKTGEARVYLNGTPLSHELNSVEVSRAASMVAKNAELRAALLPVQRHAFPGEGLVAEGRDMGTVVFPDAQIKFFVTAQIDVRAGRRHQQISGKGGAGSLDEISRELAERDKRDAERDVAPMKAAPDAVTIDNSMLPLDEVVEIMARHVEERS